MTQLETLRRHLNTVGDISGVEAWSLYNIRALPRRISDLEEKGLAKVRRERRKAANGQTYVRYFKA